MKRGLRYSVAAMAAAVIYLMSPSAAHAAAPADSLNDLTRPVKDTVVVGPVRDLTHTEFKNRRAAAGKPLTAREDAALAADTCKSYTVTQSGENVYGGVLYKLTGTVSWCYDGSTVTAGTYGWSYSTGYGWYFDSWTNPPNGFFIPGGREFHTVAQAKFCITWCGGKAYRGADIWGTYNGGYGWSKL